MHGIGSGCGDLLIRKFYLYEKVDGYGGSAGCGPYRNGPEDQ